MDVPKRKRRWWQFGVKELLIAVTCIGVDFGCAPFVLFHDLGGRIIDGIFSYAVTVSVLGLPIGIAVGVLARNWIAAACGIAAGMALWFIVGWWFGWLAAWAM